MLNFQSDSELTILDLVKIIAESTLILNQEKLDSLEAKNQGLESKPKLKEIYIAALLNRGQAYARMGNYRDATEDFDRVIADSQHGKAYFEKARCRAQLYQDGKRYKEEVINAILLDFSYAIAKEPSNSGYYAMRGCFYVVLKIFDKAEIDLKKAIELDPNNSFALYHFANFLELKDITRAIALYDRVIANKDKFCMSPALHNRGYLKLITNQLPEAIMDFLECLSLNSDSGMTYLLLSGAYFAQNKYLEAYGCVEAAIALKAGDHSTFLLRAAILSAMGEKKKSQQTITVAAKIWALEKSQQKPNDQSEASVLHKLIMIASNLSEQEQTHPLANLVENLFGENFIKNFTPDDFYSEEP